MSKQRVCREKTEDSFQVSIGALDCAVETGWAGWDLCKFESVVEDWRVLFPEQVSEHPVLSEAWSGQLADAVAGHPGARDKVAESCSGPVASDFLQKYIFLVIGNVFQALAPIFVKFLAILICG